MNLDLRWNEIGNHGIAPILNALIFNNRIETLDLTGNKISEEFLIDLEMAL